MSTKPISPTAATRFDLSAAALHILAMALMLMDHLWATLLPAQEWLTCAGRVAFPIFAFMAVEGYFHTHDLKKYTLRLLLFALLSEVPFDLMYGGTWFYPVHQNVIWTLLLGILGIHLMETVRKKQKTGLYLLVSALVVVAGAVLGTLGMVDYYGAGVLTVFISTFFTGTGASGGVCWGSWQRCTGSTWSCWAGLCTPFSSSAWTLSFASRGWRCWHWCPSGCTAVGRATTASLSSMPATPFTPCTCCCWFWC